MRQKARGGRERDLSPPDRSELLRSVPMFSSLDSEQITQLSLIGRWRTPEANETLFDEGQRGQEMFIVARGRIALTKSSLDGPKFIAERGRGEVLGEMALFDGRRRSATAVCRTDCLLLMITQSEFVSCVKKNPAVALGVIANLIDRLREADTRATRATSLEVLGRLAHQLVASSRIVGGRQIVRPRPSAQQLGTEIGCSRETVSRKLTELEESDLILRHPDHIEILDEDELNALAGD